MGILFIYANFSSFLYTFMKTKAVNKREEDKIYPMKTKIPNKNSVLSYTVNLQ